MTYLITVFAFTVELPVLAHLSTELVHVRSRGRELIVQGEVIETLEHVALLLASILTLRTGITELVSLRHESSCRFEERNRLRVVLERGLLLLLILGGGLDVLLGLDGGLKLLAFLNGYRCADIERATSRESYSFGAVVGNGSES